MPYIILSLCIWGHIASVLHVLVCPDVISQCELETLGVPIPMSPGRSFRLTVPVNKVIVFHMCARPGCLWEQQFGCKDQYESLLIFSPQETGCLLCIS